MGGGWRTGEEEGEWVTGEGIEKGEGLREGVEVGEVGREGWRAME